VENGNIEKFSEGVIRLLKDHDLANAIGANARKYVMSECSWSAGAEKMESLYYDLLDRRNRLTESSSESF
jgi:glycosyltransferase involved in cell wall biosynthesis